MVIRPTAPTPVSLRRDVAEPFDLQHSGDVEGLQVSGVTLDSRLVQPGDLYAALPGSRTHGADFAAQAVDAGAVALLTDAQGAEIVRNSGVEVPVLVADTDPRAKLGEIAARIFGTDRFDAKVFGVTGTNGKTSVVYLLDILLRAAGYTPGLSSTAERRVGNTVITSNLTSPESPELHGLLARMNEEHVDAVALEVSAHAVVRHRVDGVKFDVVAFNNLSQDHLDDFGDMETYFQAKLALFDPRRADRGVVVVDSPEGQRIARDAEIPVTRLSTEYGQEAEWHVALTRQSIDGVSFVMQGPGGEHFRGSVPVFGRFMAENAALALVMLHDAGVPLAQVSAGLDNGVIPVYIPGRLERVAEFVPRPHAQRKNTALSAADQLTASFFVDYGHTPGAFHAMLDALDEVAPGRVIFMFGADGDRDTTKREEMGRIAAAGSDELIICDYHPRSEPPENIRAQLIAGAKRANRARIHEVADPGEAVRFAISLAAPGDVILYAGPGHEDYQEVAGQKIPYSARDEVRGALREAGLLK